MNSLQTFAPVRTKQKLNCQTFVSHVFFAGFRIEVTVLHYPPSPKSSKSEPRKFQCKE